MVPGSDATRRWPCASQPISQERSAPVFGGVNLEDIAAPRCFEVEARLRQSLDIPVMHDDQHGTALVATGRSDYPNQINNSLGFPGIFRGALEVRATDINEAMKLAAAEAIAALIDPDELHEDYIIPSMFDPRVAAAVAHATREAALATGAAGTVRVSG